MCGSSPKAPSMPDPEPLSATSALPTPAAPKQAPPVAPMAPPPTPVAVQQAPPPVVAQTPPTAPPPVLVDGTADAPVVKKRKSKRAEVQQRSKGTSVLRIPLNTNTSDSNSASGLNIPTQY